MSGRDTVAGTRLYLIDGSAYVHRAFHALPPLSTRRGLPTNAVLGFARMLAKLLREEAARHVVCVFDAPGKTFRNELYAGYKAHRPPLPDELREQIPYIRRLVAAMRVAVVEVPGVEADDVIGTLATQAAAQGLDTVVVSADKDLMQIVDDHVELFDEMRGRRIGPAEVEERFGVPPPLVPDVLALVGDASDAIPGVAGIGPKTAAAVVSALGSIDAVLADLDAVERLPIRGAKRVRERLADGAENARLSRTLATIRRDVPVTLDLDEAQWPGPDAERLGPLLEELEFSQLARELMPEPSVTVATERRVLDDAAAVAASVRRLASAPFVAVAAALGGARPTVAPIDAIALWSGSGPVEVLPEPGSEALRVLGALLASPAVTKVGGGLKALQVALARRDVPLGGPRFDVELASYCLNPSRPAHDAASVAREMLGAGGIEDDPTGVVAAVQAAWALRAELEEQMERQAVSALFRDLEMPLADVLARMELDGIRVDADALAAQSHDLAAELAALLDEIHTLAGTEFNVNSPAQLREILFDRLDLPTKGVKKTKTGFSTDVDVLTKLAALHPLPARILDYRARAKLKSTYVDALPELIDPTTGRVHTTFNQTVAATGRLSSSDPNLQNIPIRSPEGRRIRRAFVADRGCALISADYSQIELRILAHLARDERLIEAFAGGEDVHARTAADVFGDRDPAEGRRLAKVINYGIVYGMGPGRAARELAVSVNEASGFIQSWFDRYAGVRRFLDETLDRGRAQGYVSTLLGRRRYLPELAADQPSLRSFAERAAVNTPVQGSAADLIKLAMLEVDRRLAERGGDGRMLLQVHDELLVEAPVERADEVATLVAESMRGVWTLEVPLEVEVAVGPTWADVH